MITVQRLTPDDWWAWRHLRLEALREAPEAFGATLADWQGAGDTEQRWRHRLTTVPLNLIADVNGRPAGMAAGTWNQADAELISMWVAPFARGQGVGDRLVDAVVEWAQSQGASRIILHVKTDNAPAIRLYRRHDFTDAGPSPESGTGSPERLFVRFLRHPVTGGAQ